MFSLENLRINSQKFSLAEKVRPKIVTPQMFLCYHINIFKWTSCAKLPPLYNRGAFAIAIEKLFQ